MSKIALITRVTGQDGALLARFLLERGYAVHGIQRRSSSFDTGRVDSIYHDPHETGVPFFLHYGDASKARSKLDWAPRVKFSELVREMVDADLDLIGKDPRRG